MTISLIACVIKLDNQLIIGKSGDLVVNLKEDIKYFKNTTSFVGNAPNLPNIVIMGRNTYYSIPSHHRPLPNRINFVLTNDKDYLQKYPLPKHKNQLQCNVYFITFNQFVQFYTKYSPNVYVIGGKQIYNLFLNNINPSLVPTKLFITQVAGVKLKDSTGLINMNHFSYKYHLNGYSTKYTQDSLTYRILFYNFNKNHISAEFEYFKLFKNVLNNGIDRIDRTGTGTKSLFGAQMRFDISTHIPLLTTKQVSFKAIVEELLFFCRGDSDTKILDNKGIHIWNGNTTRQFLDNRNLHHYEPGIMGNMYGWSWRHFGAKYSQAFADTSKCDTTKIGGFDQLENVLHLLKTDPFSRRIYISNLNPSETHNMCLDMCHTYIQFYVTENNNQRFLSAYFTMRSSDSLAFCYNIVSYTLLVYILALKCDMKPKEIVYNSVDCHIYKNHIDQIQTQMTRIPRPLPSVQLSKTLKIKDWSHMTFQDFDLVGYFPHPSIKMEMAV